MPCSSEHMEPTPNEMAQTKDLREEIEALSNSATADIDILREYVLGNVAAERILGRVNKPYHEKYLELRDRNARLYVKVKAETLAQANMLVTEYETVDELVHAKAGGKPIGAEQMTKLEAEQIEHREQDLRRLMKTFAHSVDRERLKKVLEADNTKPLQAQLGFDPDEF